MRVGIVGAGALGSLVGGLLSHAGVDVVLLRRDKQHVEHVQANGLKLEGMSGDKHVRPVIVNDPSGVGKVDLAIVLVKAYDTQAAVPAVATILGENGAVLTLQNGVGNYEILEEAFPGRVLLGTTTNGALALGRGEVRHTGIGQTHFGEAHGRESDRTRAIAEMLAKLDFGPVHVVDNAMGSVWSKLVINAAINAPGTILRVRNGGLVESDAGRELIHQIVEECLAVVKARGIKLIFDDPEAQVVAVCEATATNLNSMFQDIRLGRKTEIDFINGAVAREAEAVGVPAPTNRTLALIIEAMEATADQRVPDSD
jgi:2-dehydropantoate 2-reductase